MQISIVPSGMHAFSLSFRKPPVMQSMAKILPGFLLATNDMIFHLSQAVISTDTDNRIFHMSNLLSLTNHLISSVNLFLTSNKSDFIGSDKSLYGVIHDLKSPLMTIGPYSQIFINETNRSRSAGGKFEESEYFLTRIKVGLDVLHNNMLTLQNASSFKTPIDVQRIIDEATRICNSSFPVKTNIDEQIEKNPPFILVNEQQMRSVFITLITNSMQAMTEGEITIDVSYFDKGLRFIFGDTGHGMTEDVMAKIFDPYFTTKAQGIGTGIGLAIAKQIIEDQGGSIAVESHIGIGTKFTITLPPTLKR